MPPKTAARVPERETASRCTAWLPSRASWRSRTLGEHRNPIYFEERVLIPVGRKQDLTELNLIGLNCALDLRHLHQRLIRMQGDHQLAVRSTLDVVDELLDILGLEVRLWVRASHGPFLREHRGRPAAGDPDDAHSEHEIADALRETSLNHMIPPRSPVNLA